MSMLRKIIASLCILIVLGLATANPALAKKRKKAPEQPTTKASWVLSYAIVGLGVGLGLAGVCRPGRRSKEVKR